MHTLIKKSPYLFVLLCLSSYGQSSTNPETDTIKWEYKKIENRVQKETVSLSGTIISYGGTSFKWHQNNVDREYVFEVKSVKGNWKDASKDGELVYTAVCNEIEGTIHISRRKKLVTIVLDFVKPDKRTPHLVLDINSITKI